MKTFVKLALWFCAIVIMIRLLPLLGTGLLIAALFFAIFKKAFGKALLSLVGAILLFFIASAFGSHHSSAEFTPSPTSQTETSSAIATSSSSSSNSENSQQRELIAQPSSQQEQTETTPLSSKSQFSKTSKDSSKSTSNQTGYSQKSVKTKRQAKKPTIAISRDSKVEENGTLPFTKKKQLYLKPLDEQRRASLAHIQLQDNDEPKIKRNERITYNPVGWKNFQFYYLDGQKKAWLMNRGHLIGYQFSGIDEEPENLVPMTAWLNTGNYAGMDSGNSESMLFYEKKLDNWLANHPNYWLDYQVRAIYNDNDVWPSQVELQYVGLDSNGQLLTIQLNTEKETIDQYGVTRVLLDNTSPNATIDYQNGTANPTVSSAEVQERARQAQEKAALEASQEETTTEEQAAPVATNNDDDTIVYVTGGGKSHVYWYSTSNMPHNTNLNNLVQMTKGEAERLGKRHSLSE